MKYKGYILFAIIALMFLINLGVVSAASYQRLNIKDGTYSSTTGNLVINYTNSNIPKTDLGNSWQRNMPNIINVAWTIYDDSKLSVFVIYFPNELDAGSKSILDSTLSESFYTGNSLTIFSSNNFENYCGNSRQDLVSKLKEKGLSDIKFADISCRYNFFDPSTGVLNITSDDYKDKTNGVFYVYLLRYNVLHSKTMFSMTRHANLEALSESSPGRYTYQLISDETKIFTTPNYFATSYTIRVGSTTNTNPGSTTSKCIGVANGNLEYSEECEVSSNGTIYFRDNLNNPVAANNMVTSKTCVSYDSKYTSGNLKCNKEKCTIDTSDCSTSPSPNDNPAHTPDSTTQPRTPSSGPASAGITLTPVNASGDGYICDNHVCYFTKNTATIQFTVSGKTGDTCYYSNKINTDWNTPSTLNNCSSVSTSFEIGQNLTKKIDLTSSSINVQNLNQISPINSGNYLLVGTPTDYDYYFFVYVDDVNSINVDIYKINNRKLIKFYGGSLPEWIPGVAGGISDSITPEPTTSEKCDLFNQKLCSFRMVDLNSDINQTGITGPGQIIKDSDANLEMTIKIKYDSLNFTKDNEVIKDMNDLVTEMQMTEEEHAIWFAIIGSESNFDKTVTVGTDGVSFGVGQVNVNTWGNSNIDYLTSHPKLIEFVRDARITITSNQDYLNFVNDAKTDHKKGLILSAAIFLESRDKLQTEFKTKGIDDIDKPNGSIDLAINTAFGSFYQYMIGSDSGAKNFTKGIPAVNDYYPYKIHDGTGELDSWSVYASMRKTAYYLYFYDNFMELYHPGYWK